TVEYATDVARAAGARRLALFHHDPGHDDAAVDRLEALARERLGRDLEVFAAAEGLEIEVRGGGATASAKTDISALTRRPIAGGLAQPFSPPLRPAGVRAWLARSLAAEDRRQEPALAPMAPLNSETLRIVPVFRDMGRDELEALLAQSSDRRYPAGHELVAE